MKPKLNSTVYLYTFEKLVLKIKNGMNIISKEYSNDLENDIIFGINKTAYNRDLSNKELIIIKFVENNCFRCKGLFYILPIEFIKHDIENVKLPEYLFKM